MKHLDIMQEGGYPFDDVSIDYLQKMHDERDSFLYAVFGDNKIVNGVVLNTQTNVYSDGLITVLGKLFHFVGGAPNAKISKKVIETKRQYEDGLQKKAFVNEFYEFGTGGIDVIDFSTLKRWYQNQPILKEIKEVAGSVTNTILAGSGWFIADGQNGTDDLRSLFIVGYNTTDSDYNVVGKTGGSKKHQLSESEMPAHKHGMEDGGDKDSGYSGVIAATDSNGTQSLNNAYTKETGGNTPHENRPPYFVAIRIQFLGI